MIQFRSGWNTLYTPPVNHVGMGESVPVGRACGRCGEQVVLSVATERGAYTDDLTALLNTKSGNGILVEAECDCPSPRRVTLEGAPFSAEAIIDSD